jgi:hypothetical protein
VPADDIASLADGLRVHGALGRSEALIRLFDYLVGVSTAGGKPKELEVAAAVFGRDSGFDGAQDASVRVAAHRLRKKLEDYYAGPGRDEPVRLTVPRGEYRLVAVPAELAPAAEAPLRKVPRWAVALGVLAALNLAAWAGWWASHRDGYEPLRRMAPWSQLIGGGHPLLVVLGDYYIFGDLDEATGAGRLVREYGINSSADLDAWLMDHPALVDRYRDLDLFYLPVGAAAALRHVMPVLAPKASDREQVRVITASDLTPEMIRRNDILYVGYLSGLKLLRDPVFAGSRFRVGDTYDELIDTRTGRRYQSQEGGPAEGQSSQRDLGYFAAFRGPTGNRIVIVAGARDVGLTETAEAVTNSRSLRDLLKAANGADAYEGLFEAEGLRRATLGGRLVLGSPLDAAHIWVPPRKPPQFPAG